MLRQQVFGRRTATGLCESAQTRENLFRGDRHVGPCTIILCLLLRWSRFRLELLLGYAGVETRDVAEEASG
jgi:hypothetical protein